MAGDDEEDEFIPPLPPVDRLWRHPTEFAAEHQKREAERERRWRRERVAIGSAAAILGAGLSLLVVLAGFGGGDNDAVGVETLVSSATTSATDDDLGDLAGIDRTLSTGARVRTFGPRAQVAAGIFLPRDGYVLTSAAALTGATEIVVQLDNNVELPATLVGRDLETDLAVLQVNGQNLPSALLGDSAAVRAGDTVIVLQIGSSRRGGNELAIAKVVATDRRVEMNGRQRHGLVQLQFETGSAANGFVLTSDFRVIGVAHGEVGALGYAETIDWVMRIADDLIDDGVVEHAWLGMDGADVKPDDADRYGAVDGVRVTNLQTDGPAAEAGLAVNDVIVGIDHLEVRTMSDLVLALRLQRPGDEIELRYLRHGQEWRCRPSLGVAPTSPPESTDPGGPATQL